MNPPETNDPLDALLKDNDAYVDDHGFTARVMATLPRRRGFSARQIVLLGAALAGCVAMIWLMPSLGDIVSVGPNGNYSLHGQWWWIIVPVVAALAAVYWGFFSVVESDD